MDKSSKIIIALLSIIAVLLLGTAITFGVLYFQEKNSIRNEADINRNIDSTKTSTNTTNNGIVTPTDSGNTTTDTDKNVEPVYDPNKVSTKVFTCSQFPYFIISGLKNPPKMNIVYKDSKNVAFLNSNTKCENMMMTYKGAVLSLTYGRGEAFPTAFPSGSGTPVITLKSGKSPEGAKINLGREKTVQINKTSKSHDYVLHYVALETKAVCDEGNENLDAVGYPCYSGGNPFVTPTGIFDLNIPKTKTAAEVTEIVNYFDNVAKDSNYTPMK